MYKGLKKQFLLIGLCLLMTISCSQKKGKDALIVTHEMVEAQKRLCPAKYLLDKIEGSNKSLDTLSVDEIKKIIKVEYDYYLDNKKTIIETHNKNNVAIEEEFVALKKSFLPTEEIFKNKNDVYNDLVNNNHIQYRDSLKKGICFNQTFKNNSSYILPELKNNGSTVYEFSTGKTIAPFFDLNFNSEETIKVSEIYYHDSKKDSIPFVLDELSFPLNPIKMPIMKHIDSVKMDFKIKYLSQIDTIHFTKNDIGVQKGEFKLLKMEDNYIAYELPYSYFESYKGDVIEEVFYNKFYKPLDTEYGLSNTENITPEQSYKNELDHIENIHTTIKNITTRDSIYLALKYFELVRTNTYLKSKVINRQVVKGNVEAFTLYLESTRDSISFSTVFKNSSPVKKLYVHELEDKTEFITKNGKVISSLPSEINFLYCLKGSFYSDIYAYTEDEEKVKTYYYLDNEKGNYSKLPYSDMQYLAPTLIGATQDDNTIILLNTSKHELLIEKKITKLINLINLILQVDDRWYKLLDQNRNIITPKTNIPITRIELIKD